MIEVYDILILVEKDNGEILLRNKNGKFKYGISKIEGGRFYDKFKMGGGWYDIKEMLNYHNYEDKERLLKNLNYYTKEGYKLLSGGEEYIVGELMEILTLIEII
jgi:hypothetical protein